MKKVAISDIVDENGNRFQYTGKELSIEASIKLCLDSFEYIKRGEYKLLADLLISLRSLMEISFFLACLRRGERLDPIAIENGRLRDGSRRLAAHVLFGSEYVEYVDKYSGRVLR